MPRRAEPEDVSDQILTAAIELFAATSYASVKVPQIAARARVGLGTLYQHFPSKEALGNAVHRKCRTVWASYTLDQWPVNATPHEEFTAYWLHLCDYVDANLEIARYNEQAQAHDYDAKSKALQRDIDRRSDDALRSWVASRDVRDLPLDVMRALIHGTFDHIIRLPVSAKKRRTLLDDAGKAIWQALAAN